MIFLCIFSKASCIKTDTIQAEAEPLQDQHQSILPTCTDAFTQTDAESAVITTGTQWCNEDLQDHTYRVMSSKTTHDTSTQTTSSCIKSVSKGVSCLTTHVNMSCDKISTDADSLLYTGLTLQVFITFTQVFRSMVTPFKFTMDVADQLLLFLMRLRLNLLFADLGHRFGTSESNASKIFNCWLPLISQKLKQLIVWLPRETIRSTMPAAFREKYPKTTVIIDCAETFIQRPKNLKTRGETYSQYKSHNTVKYLVGISPHGQIMFISKGFGGRASDKFIVEKSGLLQYLLPGDEIMADRGFTIKDLLFPLRVKLNMPAFTKGKPQLSEMEVTETRRIAHVRIHVERAIRKLKVFKILSNIVPVSSVKKLDDILIVCSALVNLGPELIKDAQDVDHENSNEND